MKANNGLFILDEEHSALSNPIKAMISRDLKDNPNFKGFVDNEKTTKKLNQTILSPPPWNLPQIKQAIGRGLRNYSHDHLPSATDMKTTPDEISVLIKLLKPKETQDKA
jgi:hypothetical protein